MDILFLVIFLSFFTINAFIYPWTGVDIRRFSIPSFFLLFYLVFVSLGPFILFYGLAAYPVSMGVVEKDIIFMMMLYSNISLTLILLGFVYSRHVLGLRIGVEGFHGYYSSNFLQRWGGHCLLLVCLIILWIYLSKIDAIALFELFDGGSQQAAVARSNMGSAFPGKYWRYKLFFRYLLDYCVVFYFSDFLIRRAPLSLLAFGLSFVFAVFTAIMAIEKGPFIKLVLLLYLAYVYFKGGKYWLPITKYFCFLGLGGLVVLYFYFMDAPDFFSVLQYISTRIFTGQIVPAYFYIDLFPEQIDFLWGRSLPNPGRIFPFEPFPLTQTVSNYMFPQDAVRGIVGSAPTVFWGEMYANFGVLGVCLSSFCLGVVLYFVSFIFFSISISAPMMALVATASLHYRDLVGTGLSSYLFDVKLFILVFVTGVLSLFGKKFCFMTRSEIRMK